MLTVCPAHGWCMIDHHRSPMAISGDREFCNAPANAGKCYVRVSVDQPNQPFDHRAAPLSDVRPSPDDPFHDRTRTARLRSSHFRVPEMRQRSHDDHFERSNGFQHTRLACGRVEIAEVATATDHRNRPGLNPQFWSRQDLIPPLC